MSPIPSYPAFGWQDRPSRATKLKSTELELFGRHIADYAVAVAEAIPVGPAGPPGLDGGVFTSVLDPVYAADPTGGTDSAAKIQQAIDDVAAAGGGVVYFPRGTYRCDSNLHRSDDYNNVSLIGENRGCSKLQFTTDSGSGTYAIHLGKGSAETRPKIANLHIIGPGSTHTPGVAPASMHGFHHLSGFHVDSCFFEGFYAGIAANGDHGLLTSVYSSNNYYGFYLEPAPYSLGDFEFWNVQTDGNTKASYAIAADNQMDGFKFVGGHVGFGPYGFYGEDGAGLREFMLSACAFYMTSFESWAHAAFKAQGGNRSMSCAFVQCNHSGDFDLSPTFNIAGEPKDAAIDLGGAAAFASLGSLPFGGPGDVAAIKGSLQGAGEIGSIVDACRTAGKPLVVGGAADCDLTYYGREADVLFVGNTVSYGDVLEAHAFGSARRFGTDAWPHPVANAVALLDGASSDLVPVIRRGRAVVNASGSVGFRTRVVPDRGTTGKVRAYQDRFSVSAQLSDAFTGVTMNTGYDTTLLHVGMAVHGKGIPPNTVVATIDSATSFSLSQNAIATDANATVIVGDDPATVCGHSIQDSAAGQVLCEVDLI